MSIDGSGKSLLSLRDTTKDWLNLVVETNPLDETFDHFVGFNTRPVLLRYDAILVEELLRVFKPPASVQLTQLTNAALAKFEEVRERSVTGLQYAVEKKTRLKLEILIEPAILAISKGGAFDKTQPTLLTELGKFTIQTTDDISNMDIILVS